MSHIFRAIWPIVATEYSVQTLTAEAQQDLPRLTNQAHAVITGPGRWYIAPGHTIPGAGGLSDYVLVHDAPALPRRRRNYHPNEGAKTA